MDQWVILELIQLRMGAVEITRRSSAVET